MDKKNILVLCTGNSCRSQIAEGYLRLFAGEKATVYSAGIQTHGLNPKAVATMLADDIDISGHTSNHIDEYAGIAFDYVITVCDNAKEHCPYLPSKALRLHYSFPDPAAATGTDDEVNAVFASVRDQIKTYVLTFISTNFNSFT